MKKLKFFITAAIFGLSTLSIYADCQPITFVNKMPTPPSPYSQFTNNATYGGAQGLVVTGLDGPAGTIKPNTSATGCIGLGMSSGVISFNMDDENQTQCVTDIQGGKDSYKIVSSVCSIPNIVGKVSGQTVTFSPIFTKSN